MKKISSIIICLIFLFLFTNNIFANVSNYQPKDILQDNKLLNEFIKGAEYHQDVEGNFIFEKETVIDNLFSDEKEVCKETLAIIPLNGIISRNIKRDIALFSSANGSIDVDDWDPSGAIQAHLIVKYKIIEKDGNEFVKMTSIRGKHSKISSGVRVKSQEVEYGSVGFYPGGFQEKRATYKPRSSSWTKRPPSSWKPVYTSESCTVGAQYTLTVGRGSDEWDFTIENNIYE